MSTGDVVSICFMILDKVDVPWLVQRPLVNMDISICVGIKAACSILVLLCMFDAYIHYMLY